MVMIVHFRPPTGSSFRPSDKKMPTSKTFDRADEGWRFVIENPGSVLSVSDAGNFYYGGSLYDEISRRSGVRRRYMG